MAYSAGGEASRSGTTIVAARNDHVVRIAGYSRTLNAHGDRPDFSSRPFRAGGRTWHVSYRPMGSSHSLDNTDSVSFYLVLDDVVDEAVMAQASFSLLDRDGAPVGAYTFTTLQNNFSESRDRADGYERFIRREDLERSEYLNDDCFAVRVQVFMAREAPPSSIAVPPPDMRRHIGDLLSSKEDADVKFHVGGETFEAHRLVLGARSPVFMAEFLGPMKEGVAAADIRVDDMEPRVFEAMLTFIYTDAWPEAQMEEEDACAMAQHLLVAADRYMLESLKSMCEERLRSNHIDTGSAATILALAEQHCCPGLKEACFEFLGSPTALLAVIETKEFEYLAQSCPSVTKTVKRLKDRSFHVNNHRTTTMSLIATADPPPVAAIRGRVHGGYHVLKIDGHSRTLGTRRCFESCPFRAGEHTWLIRYYPMGKVPANTDFISIFLVLVDTAAGEEGVLAQATFSLLDKDQKSVPSYSFVFPAAYNFSQPGSSMGYHKFMPREKLKRLGLVKYDCFAVRVDVHLVLSRKESTALRPSSSGMHQHFDDLLSSNKGTDVEFRVSGETFAAHRLVLRARSPVFKAQLLTPTSKAIVVEIDDMEPRVFKALLTFIYTDAWPKTMMEQDDDEEEFEMARGLLVAADRYGLRRLKLMCENRLCSRIDRASVSTLLALSGRHNCAHLKEACFDFISSTMILFATNNETGWFDNLAQSCPDVANEVIANAINRDKEKGHDGNGQESVIKSASEVVRANSAPTSSSSLFILFTGFVISIMVNSYAGHYLN